MTLLPCTGIVWPVPAAVQVRPRQGAASGSRPAIQRARNLAGSAPAGACARAGLRHAGDQPHPVRACCAAVYWPNTASRRHTPHARAGLITSRDQRSGSPPANTRRSACQQLLGAGLGVRADLGDLRALSAGAKDGAAGQDRVVVVSPGRDSRPGAARQQRDRRSLAAAWACGNTGWVAGRRLAAAAASGRAPRRRARVGIERVDG